MLSKNICFVVLTGLSACVAPPQHAAPAPGPVFSPQAFFAGQTEGRGSLTSVLGHRTHVAVHGVGHVSPDGAITLDQIVEQEGKAPTHRRWELRPAGANHLTGSLTGAVGPVAAEVSGNRMHVRFAMDHGLIAEQWIYLQPGGQIALNQMSVSKFGVRVAYLEETIRRRE